MPATESPSRSMPFSLLTSARRPSADRPMAPIVPMPPALETAEASSAPVTPPIPAHMIGWSMPRASVSGVATRGAAICLLVGVGSGEG